MTTQLPLTPGDHLVHTLLLIDGVLALCVLLIYTLFAPWWSTKTGVGVFALYWTVGLIIFHFAAEAFYGQGQPWREIGLTVLLGIVLIWNGILIIYKQSVMRNARRKRRIKNAKHAARARAAALARIQTRKESAHG